MRRHLGTTMGASMNMVLSTTKKESKSRRRRKVNNRILQQIIIRLFLRKTEKEIKVNNLQNDKFKKKIKVYMKFGKKIGRNIE